MKILNFEIQTGVILCSFFFVQCRFNMTLKIYTTFQMYIIILGLLQFGIDDLWLH